MYKDMICNWLVSWEEPHTWQKSGIILTISPHSPSTPSAGQDNSTSKIHFRFISCLSLLLPQSNQATSRWSYSAREPLQNFLSSLVQCTPYVHTPHVPTFFWSIPHGSQNALFKNSKLTQSSTVGNPPMASRSTLDKGEIPSYGHQGHGQSEPPPFSKFISCHSLPPIMFSSHMDFPCFFSSALCLRTFPHAIPPTLMLSHS